MVGRWAGMGREVVIFGGRSLGKSGGVLDMRDGYMCITVQGRRRANELGDSGAEAEGGGRQVGGQAPPHGYDRSISARQRRGADDSKIVKCLERIEKMLPCEDPIYDPI